MLNDAQKNVDRVGIFWRTKCFLQLVCAEMGGVFSRHYGKLEPLHPSSDSTGVLAPSSDNVSPDHHVEQTNPASHSDGLQGTDTPELEEQLGRKNVITFSKHYLASNIVSSRMLSGAHSNY